MKSVVEQALVAKVNNIYACSEAIIELEHMHVMKPEPSFPGSGFWFLDFVSGPCYRCQATRVTKGQGTSLPGREKNRVPGNKITENVL